MRRALAVLLLMGALAVPRPAAAFRDHDSFALPALEGGGGERWFTGSLRDGYTCAVCHIGGVTPLDVELGGIPEAGWSPGQTYTITLELPDATAASAALEITDREGAAIGILTVPAALESADQCEPQEGLPPEPAIFVAATPDGREVATVDDCGADRLQVQWRAPAEPAAGVTLYAVAVAGDGDVDPRGDGVRELVRPLPAAGDTSEGPRVRTACAVRPGHREVGGPAVVLAVAAGVLRARRRAASRAVNER